MIRCLMYQFFWGHGMPFHSRNSSLFHFWQYCWIISLSIYFSLLAWLCSIGILFMDLIWLTCLSTIFMSFLSQSPSFSIHFACFPVLSPVSFLHFHSAYSFLCLFQCGFHFSYLLPGFSQPLGHTVSVVKSESSEIRVWYHLPEHKSD